MLNLIKADLYKSFHRVYFYVLTAALAGLSLFVTGICAHSGASLENTIGLSLMLFVYPLFVICMFADMTAAEENKEHTLKNTVAYGISREKIYFAKNISTIILGVIAAAVTLLVYIGSALILTKPESSDYVKMLPEFAERIGVVLLLYVAACTLASMLALLIKKNTLFTFSYFGVLVLPTLIFKLLTLVNHSFQKAQDFMLYSQVQIVASVPRAQLLDSVWVALVHIALFTVVGLFLFKKQEIN